MALDKKQIALSVTGIIAGLALTYILWRRSQQAQTAAAASAAAQAAAAAATQEQQSQQLDYATGNLSAAGGGSYNYGSNVTESGVSTPVASSSSATDGGVGAIVSQILGSGTGTLPTIPSNGLIPEVSVSDGTTSLSGIDTSAAQILGQAPPSTVSTTTSTGQTYGATTANTGGGDSNTTAATPTGNGGNPVAIYSPSVTSHAASNLRSASAAL